MARTSNEKSDNGSSGATFGYEAQLWQMADALRGSMDAAEYRHVCLGPLFLNYISDAFEEKHAALLAEEARGADPEDSDEYRAQSTFWVPPKARWSHLKAQARQSTIGQLVVDAEGTKGGEFCTPRCVVNLLVEMLEPYHGRVYDPCGGSSGWNRTGPTNHQCRQALTTQSSDTTLVGWH